MGYRRKSAKRSLVDYQHPCVFHTIQNQLLYLKNKTSSDQKIKKKSENVKKTIFQTKKKKRTKKKKTRGKKESDRTLNF